MNSPDTGDKKRSRQMKARIASGSPQHRLKVGVSLYVCRFRWCRCFGADERTGAHAFFE